MARSRARLKGVVMTLHGYGLLSDRVVAAAFAAFGLRDA